MLINDRILGLLAILGGAATWFGALGFNTVPGQQFGSSFFPQIIGSALILCGLALALKAKAGRLVQISAMLRGFSAFQALAVIAAVIVWVWLSPLTGFIAASLLLISVLILLAGGSFVPAAATGAGMAVVLYLIFGMLLHVPLPQGLVEGLFR